MEHDADSAFNSRLAGGIAFFAGIILVVAAIFADEIGLSGGGTGIGWKQLIAAIAGAVIALLGVAWLARPGSWSSYDDRS